MNEFPYLSLLVAWPLLAAFVLIWVRRARRAKQVALVAALLELLLTLTVLQKFDPAVTSMQFLESHDWLPSVGSHYLLGVDGIAILFLPLTATVTISVILASWRLALPMPGFYWALLLLLESSTMGIFCALDLLLFFLFWELSVVPIFFLLSLWGIGSERRAAAMKYALFMFAGGLPLLFAFVLIALQQSALSDAGVSFNYLDLLKTPLPTAMQGYVFGLLVLGFAFKTPLVPLHTWLPSVAQQGPVPISAWLLGLKLGVYGLLRFAVPLAPVAAKEYALVLALLGAANAVYGALLTLHQSNWRTLLAYAGISHVGLVVVGIASLTVHGLQGALLQLVNFTFVTLGFMLLAGFMQRRFGSNETVHLGGLAKSVPALTALGFLFALATIGLPGTSGFPAELLLLLGAFQRHGGLGLAALAGAVLVVMGVVGLLRQTFWGPVQSPAVQRADDLRPHEWLALMVPLLLVFALGFYPNVVLQVGGQSVDVWLARLKP